MSDQPFYFSEQEMQSFACQMAKRMDIFPEGGKVILLNGEMGAGKTTFCRYFSEYFGIESSSPTYSLVETRSSQKATLIHADFYRENPSRSYEIFSEYWDEYSENPDTFFLLEWFPESLREEFFDDIPVVDLRFTVPENTTVREINLSFCNPCSASVPQAYALQKKWKTPVHVQNHIEVVRKVSVFCAQKLWEQGVPVDMQLVEASALLHDAVRYVDFSSFTEEDFRHYKEEITPEKLDFWKKIRAQYRTVHHAHAMQHILELENLHATARTVASHYTGEIYRITPFSWEEKCVYYADKRALHDLCVPLSQRLEDGRIRYNHEKNPQLEEKIYAMENELQQYGKWKELVLEER